MLAQVRGDVPSFQIPVAAAIAISFFLVPLSGLFAGLTIGLLSLDKVGLRVRHLHTWAPRLACPKN